MNTNKPHKGKSPDKVSKQIKSQGGSKQESGVPKQNISNKPAEDIGGESACSETSLNDVEMDDTFSIIASQEPSKARSFQTPRRDTDLSDGDADAESHIIEDINITSIGDTFWNPVTPLRNGKITEKDRQHPKSTLLDMPGPSNVIVLRSWDGREISLVSVECQTDAVSSEQLIYSPSPREDMISEPGSPGHGEIPEEDHYTVEKTQMTKQTMTIGKTELPEVGDGQTECTADEQQSFEIAPVRYYNDEFGIPVLDLSSDSDDSSVYDVEHTSRCYPYGGGPPQILQYIRESQLPGDESGKLKTNLAEYPELFDKDGRPTGMFGGKCEFCLQDIKPFPTMEQQQKYTPESLFCCDQYREFVQFAISTAMELEEKFKKDQTVIDIKAHSPVGSKKSRRAAKERAMERMHEREMMRRQQEAARLAAASQSAAQHGSSATQIPSVSSIGVPYEASRQMKTITYQLSSQKCLEEGWTLFSPRFPEYLNKEVEVFIPEPIPPDVISAGKIWDRPLIEKFYDTGKKFLTIFPDGSGNVFYPSGNLAILISSTRLGQYTYTTHEDDPNHPTVTAVFSATGTGFCNFASGKVRLSYNQFGGIELNHQGGRRRCWKWWCIEPHIHAPPFQPVCMSLNPHLGVRIMTQDYMTLTFLSKQRSCRFQFGSRLLEKSKFQPPMEANPSLQFLKDRKTRVESILAKIAKLLKFPKSPKLEKFLPPVNIIRTPEVLHQNTPTSGKSSRSRKKVPLSVVVSVN